MRVVPLLALLGALAASGCFEPHRVHVEEAILAQANGWVESREGVRGGGLGPRTQETRYTYDPASTNPPFPGTLQVFSIRALSQPSNAQLLDLAETALTDGADEHAIALDDSHAQGERTLDSGVRTSWLLRAGRTTQPGNVFEDEVRIRILAEVGHDGKSDTSFLAIAIVQVERTQQCPVLCQPVRSEATWNQVVGDPEGNVQGATSQTGFIDHLETR